AARRARAARERDAARDDQRGALRPRALAGVLVVRARGALARRVDRSAEAEADAGRSAQAGTRGGERMRLLSVVLVGLCWLVGHGRAAAWDPFVVENDHVAAGNEAMGEGDARRALTHYDRAARELPDRAEVHLNRGLALLEAGELDRAREALLLATEPPAERDVRADAYYDLGLAFYRQADAAAAAEEPNHREAQRLFREAADAFRRSLRIRPGNADAGWNLELALRRV